MEKLRIESEWLARTATSATFEQLNAIFNSNNKRDNINEYDYK
jgi:hypothetical protein